MARLKIVDLQCRALIGIHPDERKRRQPIRISLTIDYDPKPGISTDRIGGTLDYQLLANQVKRSVEKSRFFLIEKMAQSILDQILTVPRVKRVVVEIQKPKALKKAAFISFITSGST